MLKKGALLLLFVCLSAFAQETQLRAVATVPFEFIVGNQVLPAGDYEVRTIDPHRMLLSNVQAHKSVIVDVIEIPLRNVTSDAKLVFRRDGDQSVLHRIVLQTDDHMHDVNHGKDVIELASN